MKYIWLVVSNISYFPVFHTIWDNLSHWLIFLRGIETTNQSLCKWRWCCNPHNHHFTKGGIVVLDSWSRGSDRWNWRLMAVQPSQNVTIPSDSFRPLANTQLFVSNVYVEKSLSLNDFWIHSHTLYIYIYAYRHNHTCRGTLKGKVIQFWEIVEFFVDSLVEGGVV